jgi:hypothetical protein
MTTGSNTQEIDELIQTIIQELNEGNNKNIKSMIEGMIEKETNRRFNEEAEKYEDCLKKLESDIRKHIQVISIVK